MATTAEGVLYYKGEPFDPDDLNYEEVIEVRRIIRMEMWDESTHGPFDWRLVDEFFIYPATITVFKQREDPTYSIDQAVKAKLTELTDEPPPTKPAPRQRSNGSAPKGKSTAAGAKTPVVSGSQT